MVYVYALCDVFYDSFYLKGIKDVYQSYTFNVSKFPKFKQDTFAAIIIEKGSEKKIIIDSNDGTKYNLEALEWCDVYGKINYNLKDIPSEFEHKIIPIGPSFGIKIWNLFQTLFLASINTIKFYKFINNKRTFVANYWRQYNRLRLDSYKWKKSSDTYVFFTSSIWKNEPKTNDLRAAFIKACALNDKLEFEGGFAPRNDGNNLGFDDMVMPERYQFKDYLDKLKRSAFVFNTPAVLLCHGWKLAEYLALGKAIISTEHINKLPVELEENIHVLYASKDNLDEKINLIINDNLLKKRLETNAVDYFNKNLSPSVVVKKLFQI